MTEAEVRRGLIRGIGVALRRADRWSVGRVWPSDTGAENLLQVSIAEALYTAARVKPVIELEATLGRLTNKNDARRVDVALLRHGDKPYVRPRPFCVIEVKKAPGSFRNDLDKVAALFSSADTLRYGYLATYIQNRNGERARDRETTLDDYSKKVISIAGDAGLKAKRIEDKRLGPSVWDGSTEHCADAILHRLVPAPMGGQGLLQP